jgi:hypothetical protein
MSDAATVEQLYCAKCSDPADSLDEDGFGRCCHNLPNPWHLGSDGLYTEPSATVDAEQQDDESDDRPECPNCGGMRFRIHATEWRRHAISRTVSGADNERDDGTLWYDRGDFETGEIDESRDFCIQTIYCARCEDDVTRHLHTDEVY